jgi:hypothetical protein
MRKPKTTTTYIVWYMQNDENFGGNPYARVFIDRAFSTMTSAKAYVTKTGKPDWHISPRLLFTS